MLTVAICDDNAIHLKKAEEITDHALTAAQQLFRMYQFASAEDLLAWISSEEILPDLAVLDIEMGGEDGISLAKKLNLLAPGCRIIFLTSYVDYAPDAYEADHIWFVVKGRVQEHFDAAIRKALDSLKENETAIPGILVRENGRTVFLSLEEILYISKAGRKAQVKCLTGEHLDRKNPASLIPAGLQTHFIRCHQGYWVNISQISELDHEEFVLKDGSRIPISRTFREEAKRRFFERYRL